MWFDSWSDLGRLLVVVLVALQYAVSWSSRRWPAIERVVKSEPVLMYREGFVHRAMRRTRVTEDEVSAVVQETDGTLGVLASVPDPPPRRA